MKCFSHLLFFDSKLLWIRDRKPLTSAIYLKMSGKILFERGLLHGIYDLCFEIISASFKYSKIHNTPGNRTSCDDNLSTIGSDSEPFSSEYEFIDMDVFENGVFFHMHVMMRDNEPDCSEKYKFIN